MSEWCLSVLCHMHVSRLLYWKCTHILFIQHKGFIKQSRIWQQRCKIKKITSNKRLLSSSRRNIWCTGSSRHLAKNWRCPWGRWRSVTLVDVHLATTNMEYPPVCDLLGRSSVTWQRSIVHSGHFFCFYPQKRPPPCKWKIHEYVVKTKKKINVIMIRYLSMSLLLSIRVNQCSVTKSLKPSAPMWFPW